MESMDSVKHFHDLVINIPAIPPVLDTLELKIDKGLITSCGIFFAAGCHGMVNAKVYFQAHQILPRDQSQWCHGNAGWWEGYLYVPVTAFPLNIKVEGYSVGTTYPHTVQLGLEVMPFAMVPQWEKLVRLNEKLLEAIGIPLPPIIEEEVEA